MILTVVQSEPRNNKLPYESGHNSATDIIVHFIDTHLKYSVPVLGETWYSLFL